MTGSAGAPARARRRPKFTSRAAVLAIVLCAISLSLAYPVREYLGQRREIIALTAQRAHINRELQSLSARQRRLRSPAYVEQQARANLHMCLPQQTCYVVITPRRKVNPAAQRLAGAPWYRRIWSSVQQAGQPPEASAHR